MSPTPSPAPSSAPTPDLVFEMLWGYQLSAALGAAIELDLFTAIGSGDDTVETLAERTRANAKGLRTLCDFLVVKELLGKDDGRYRLTPVAATFLDRREPSCMADVATFLRSETLRTSFDHLTEAVRKGGTALPEGGTMAPDHPAWVQFARAMAPMARAAAEAVADELDRRGIRAGTVLDVAAGHGLYGVTLLSRWPDARGIAVDWADVVAVARETAEAAGVGDRFETIEGSVFDVPLPDGLDLVLLPNFLHHFDLETCRALLERLRGSLAPGGRVAIVEFVPNEDRVTPPRAAAFALVMTATTEHGDAYTRAELETCLRDAGFADVGATALEGVESTLVLATKA